nr:redoxin domain-containing protein [uncultured Pseudoxanthomonas sp.]
MGLSRHADELRPAPPWQVDRWFNTPEAIILESLRGQVVVLEAFEMLCPGCVSHGLPQAARVHATFPGDQVAVIGLHTVFEHHDAMTPVSLQAFLHEYRIGFPVGVDRPGTQGPIPQTMEAYAMRGTPTLTLIDAQGRIRHQHFGQVSDLVLGAQIASLVHEAKAGPRAGGAQSRTVAGESCGPDGCALPA